MTPSALAADVLHALSVGMEHADISDAELRTMERGHAAQTEPKPDAKAEARKAKDKALAALVAKGHSEDEAAAAINAELRRFVPVLGSQTQSLAAIMREGVPPMEFLSSPSLGEKLSSANSLLKVDGHAKHGKSGRSRAGRRRDPRRPARSLHRPGEW